MTTKEKADLVRKACQKGYCMDYASFLALYQKPDDYYTREKFDKMQKNFSKWFCELDSVMAARFMEGL